MNPGQNQERGREIERERDREGGEREREILHIFSVSLSSLSLLFPLPISLPPLSHALRLPPLLPCLCLPLFPSQTSHSSSFPSPSSRPFPPSHPSSPNHATHLLHKALHPPPNPQFILFYPLKKSFSPQPSSPQNPLTNFSPSHTLLPLTTTPSTPFARFFFCHNTRGGDVEEEEEDGKGVRGGGY